VTAPTAVRGWEKLAWGQRACGAEVRGNRLAVERVRRTAFVSVLVGGCARRAEEHRVLASGITARGGRNGAAGIEAGEEPAKYFPAS